MAAIECTVVVLGYNSENDVPRLLSSLSNQTVTPSLTLLLDNASTDRTYDLFLAYANDRADVKCRKFEQNFGFARAMNIGFSMAIGNAVCLLNSDTMLANDYLQLCIEQLDESKNIGMVTGAVCRLVNGAKTDIVDSLGIAIGKNRHFFDIGSGENYENFREPVMFPFGVGGCVPVYSRAMIAMISSVEPPFVELFGSYYEDVDLAWRAKRAGWKAVCVRGARAWHVREGSLTERSLHVVARNRCYRNRYWTLILNENPRIWASHARFWLIREMLLLLKMVFQPGLAVAMWQMFAGLPSIIERRRQRCRSGDVLPESEESVFFTDAHGRYWRTAVERRLRRIRQALRISR